MLKTLAYLLGKGVATSKSVCPPLEEGIKGLPLVSTTPCAEACTICRSQCPTDAIVADQENSSVLLDRGACISCGTCISSCPTGTIVNDPVTRTARLVREALVMTRSIEPAAASNPVRSKSIFQKSIAARVVSTGCTACDLEIGACTNPIFDMERFGVQIVASPRFADLLMVTGPVPKSMQAPLKSCYEAMAEPRLVMAVGSCAISGGVHRGGYAEANGVDSVIPVDIYVPGCPPHPWSIIHGVHLAMNALAMNAPKVKAPATKAPAAKNC